MNQNIIIYTAVLKGNYQVLIVQLLFECVRLGFGLECYLFVSSALCFTLYQ